MKFTAVGLALALTVSGAPAFAQIGGPQHGSKAAVGGAATGAAAGASIGGPASKGTVTTGSNSNGNQKPHK